MRCGAYVVRRYGRNSFEIGHVSDHSSGNDEGLMRLTLKGGRWLLYVNEPRIVRLGRFSFALARFRLWKTGG